MGDKTRGIYHKFNVTRTDGTSEPGGKHDGCYYFVLDCTHDKYAEAALRAYAEACKAEYPLLAADLTHTLDDAEARGFAWDELKSSKQPVDLSLEWGKLRGEIKEARAEIERLRAKYADRCNRWAHCRAALDQISGHRHNDGLTMEIVRELIDLAYMAVLADDTDVPPDETAVAPAPLVATPEGDTRKREAPATGEDHGR